VADKEADVDVGAFVAGAGEDDGAEAGGNGGAEGGGEGDGGAGFIIFALGVEGLVVGGVASGDGFLRGSLSGEDGDGFA